MLDDLREEAIVNKVGGRFKLSTLIQKRLVQLQQLQQTGRAHDTNDNMKIVIREILEDKIYLDAESNVRVGRRPEAGGPPELDFNALEPGK